MTKPQHKFFEKFLDNNLEELSKFLSQKAYDLEHGLVPNVSLEDYKKLNGVAPTTNLGPKYNIFQFHYQDLYKLLIEVRSMVKEACEYYSIDFDSQQYMIQGWFNFDNYEKPEPLPDRFLHDHLGGSGVPDFHGYYCVAAEPSYTKYKLGGMENGEYFLNINKNNRAILSETGHPHGISHWDQPFKRITIAYDICPLNSILNDKEQHWIPLI
jgi:hypothetical protein